MLHKQKYPDWKAKDNYGKMKKRKKSKKKNELGELLSLFSHF